MGAWGPGMQANDSALDAISEIEAELDGADVDAGALLERTASQWSDPLCVLGVAEALIERGHELWDRGEVANALEEELDPGRLRSWRNPMRRCEALERFIRRVEGESVDVAAIAEDNMGLMEKIAAGVVPEPGPADPATWTALAARLIERVKNWR